MSQLMAMRVHLPVTVALCTPQQYFSTVVYSRQAPSQTGLLRCSTSGSRLVATPSRFLIPKVWMSPLRAVRPTMGVFVGAGIRIRGGIARSYYVGVEQAMPAIPGFRHTGYASRLSA